MAKQNMQLMTVEDARHIETRQQKINYVQAERESQEYNRTVQTFKKCLEDGALQPIIDKINIKIAQEAKNLFPNDGEHYVEIKCDEYPYYPKHKNAHFKACILEDVLVPILKERGFKVDTFNGYLITLRWHKNKKEDDEGNE